ncbi:dienelactone hydrolase family protein [Dyella japonica]|uniref:Dienelactone hydrolase n=1 Tax=Dyella japonica TaxID=231455 RepID=A0ABV2K179_9GAMM
MKAIHEAAFNYASGTRSYFGLLLTGSETAPKAACVLLPDWRGLSPLARDHARFLVELGCTVVIADLYGDGFTPSSPDQVGPMVQRLVEHREEGVGALAACISQLRKVVPEGTPILCLGYSAGGMIALDYGRSGAIISGIILCSALLKTAAPGMNAFIRAPVLVLQGTQDQVSPMATIVAVVSDMDKAGNDVRFELYSQTHHAFDNPEAGEDTNARLCYSPRSGRRAQRAIASFLTEVIEQSEQSHGHLVS